MARTDTVEALLQDRDAFLMEVRERLLQAQQFAARYYVKHHREIHLEVGSWVWLRLLHRQTHILVGRATGKLAPRYTRSFKILEKIGTVAYRLELPIGTRLHDIFHVGLLKPFHGTPPSATPALPPIVNGRALPTPERILHSQLRRGVWHVLVQWAGIDEAEATWEEVNAFKQAHSEF